MTGLLKIVGNAACYGIEVLRYTFFWRKWFLNDGELLDPKSSEIIGHFFFCVVPVV